MCLLDNRMVMTFVIISNNRLESHELHIYVSRAIGIFIIRICGKAQQIIRAVNICTLSPCQIGMESVPLSQSI